MHTYSQILSHHYLMFNMKWRHVSYDYDCQSFTLFTSYRSWVLLFTSALQTSHIFIICFSSRSHLFINTLPPFLSSPGSSDQLLNSLSSPPRHAFPHLPSFLKRTSPSHYFLEYSPLCHSLLGALNFPPFSSLALFFFPPRPLTKLNPLTHSNAFHQLHKHTRGTKHVMVVRGTSSSLHLFPPSLPLFPLKVSVNNKLEKWKWGDNCESPFCVPFRASVKFSVWLKASFLWCAVWKLS